MVSAHSQPTNCKIYKLFNNPSLILDKILSVFDSIMIVDDFNIDLKNKKDRKLEKVNIFCNTLSLTNLVESHTSSTKPRSLQLSYFQQNRISPFQLTQATETEIGDHNFIKTETARLKPKEDCF